MNKLTYSLLIVAVSFVACNDIKRKPGKVYMPDMSYSRAVETYTELNPAVFNTEQADGQKIFYNAKPVAGTVRKGDIEAYEVPNGDTTGTYVKSASLVNPYANQSLGADSAEIARLWNINCGVCHGPKGDAQGPIAQRVGAVANLTLDQYKEMADGTMYHSIQFGKNNMGGYASQLSRKQRWQMVNYIRILQGKTLTAANTNIKTEPAKDNKMVDLKKDSVKKA